MVRASHGVPPRMRTPHRSSPEWVRWAEHDVELCDPPHCPYCTPGALDADGKLMLTVDFDILSPPPIEPVTDWHVLGFAWSGLVWSIAAVLLVVLVVTAPH